jgi:hypothetical protein
MHKAESYDRRRFLRQLGKSAAVGLGIALLPATRARAGALAPVYCCLDTSRCGGCFPGAQPMYCSSLNCCFCEAEFVSCKNYPFPPC